MNGKDKNGKEAISSLKLIEMNEILMMMTAMIETAIWWLDRRIAIVCYGEADCEITKTTGMDPKYYRDLIGKYRRGPWAAQMFGRARIMEGCPENESRTFGRI